MPFIAQDRVHLSRGASSFVDMRMYPISICLPCMLRIRS
nr:MAG TPA_asm: hypothetical protein [Caudoviricetes sp.]